MKIKILGIGIIILVIFFGGMGIAILTGNYNTFRSEEPLKSESGEYLISDIRGSHYLSDIEKYYKVPASVILKAFYLKEDIEPDKFQIKDLKEIYRPVEINGEEYQLETEAIRVFVSLYSGGVYEPSETVYLPKKAVTQLEKEGKFTDLQLDYWNSHSFEPLFYENEYVNALQTQVSGTSENKTADTENVFTLTGKTLILDLINHGMTDKDFYLITQLHYPDNKQMALKDFFLENNAEFSQYKTKLEEFFAGNK